LNISPSGSAFQILPPSGITPKTSRQAISLATSSPKLAGVPNGNARMSLPSGTPLVSTPPREVELDLEGMMDVTNYAGVDLKEEEFIMTESSQQNTERAKETPFLNMNQLERRVVEFGI
jgi:hypothetical protein